MGNQDVKVPARNHFGGKVIPGFRHDKNANFFSALL